MQLDAEWYDKRIDIFLGWGQVYQGSVGAYGVCISLVSYWK
jgi:hypothetical protein